MNHLSLGRDLPRSTRLRLETDLVGGPRHKRRQLLLQEGENYHAMPGCEEVPWAQWSIFTHPQGIWSLYSTNPETTEDEQASRNDTKFLCSAAAFKNKRTGRETGCPQTVQSTQNL
ncbi:unnamed protein product [Eretmochelys imbricata]